MNIFATPPPITTYRKIKYCPLCYQHDGLMIEGTIERGHSTNYCPRHARIQASRNRALIRGLYAPSLKELEAMVPPDMKCRLCDVTMGYTIRETARNSIMSLQHWHNGTVEWICIGCNSRHSSTQEPDEDWVQLVKTLEENEKFCQICKKIKDVAFFYKTRNGSKGRSAYCRICHDDYINTRRGKK